MSRQSILSIKQNFAIHSVGGHLSLGVLCLLICALLHPATPATTTAESAEDIYTPTTQSIAEPEYVPSNLSVALSASEITMNSQAGLTENREFYTGHETLTVTTSNDKGYAIYLSTAEDQSAMQNTNSALPSAILPVAPATAPSAFPGNTWGYALTTGLANDATLYNPIPASLNNTQPILTESSATAKTYTLNFGVAIDNSLPAGQYRSVVQVSVIANPEVILRGLASISTMQEMTTALCAETPAGAETILTDTRDNKRYWVAKFAKDNQCWMTQNLAYGTGPAPAYNSGSGYQNIWVGSYTDADHGSYGNYYNWSTANTVCPSGWHLPDRTTYDTLISGMTSGPQLVAEPYYFALSGDVVYDTGAQRGAGIGGGYWTSTPNSSWAYSLDFDNSSIYTTGVHNRFDGKTVRCVANS